MHVSRWFRSFLLVGLVAAVNVTARPAGAQTSAQTLVRDATQPAIEPARQLLSKALLRYRTLNRFSMNIQHQDSSGLFPGAYTQQLRWRRGGKFTLLVTSPASPKAERHAPNYYADGKRVVSDMPGNGQRFIDSIVPLPNTSPGWEVSGGLIVSVLQNTDTFRMFQGKTPLPAPVRFTFGPRSQWRGKNVREIVMHRTDASAQKDVPASFFVEPTGEAFYGVEWSPRKGTLGYAVYSNQKFNPALPPVLGKAPAARSRQVVDGTKRKRASAPAFVPPPTLPSGTPAPDFAVEDKDGKPVKLSDFAGKVVVLDFWATWCGPCQESLPHTNQVAGRFKNDVVVLAVNTWDEKPLFDKWLSANQGKYANLTFAFDPHGRDGDIAKTLYKVTGIPTQYVIGRDGKIVKGMVGYGGPTRDLQDTIQQVLSVPQATAPVQTAQAKR